MALDDCDVQQSPAGRGAALAAQRLLSLGVPRTFTSASIRVVVNESPTSSSSTKVSYPMAGSPFSNRARLMAPALG